MKGSLCREVKGSEGKCREVKGSEGKFEEGKCVKGSEGKFVQGSEGWLFGCFFAFALPHKVHVRRVP